MDTTEPTTRLETAYERKLRRDRERIAVKRAAMTPEERAEARRTYDENYRAVHRRAQSATAPLKGALCVANEK